MDATRALCRDGRTTTCAPTADDAGSDLARIAACFRLRARSTFCTGNRKLLAMEIGRDRHGLQMLQESRAAKPGSSSRTGCTTLSPSSEQVGTKNSSSGPSFSANRRKSLSIARNTFFIESDQIHLVDCDGEAADSQQPRDGSMTMRLRQQTLARIDQQHGQVRRRRAGGHVARVLLMPGSVGDDELAPRRRKIPVRDVDGNALLALRPQTVGDQRKIDAAAARLTPSARRRAGPDKCAFESCSSRPMSVDFPSSTLPAVSKRSRSRSGH